MLVDGRLKGIFRIAGLEDAFLQSATVEIALAAVAASSPGDVGVES